MQTKSHEGFLLINKNRNITSFGVISKLKNILNTKKLGHAGTLDKNAEGLLIVAVNKSTKLLKYFVKQNKTYIAQIFFGKQTSTDDPEGDIINEYNGEISEKNILSALIFFNGKIKQTPPDFSAIHVNGKRAYKIALNNEKPKLKEREIIIYKNNFLSFNSPILDVEFECSSGTYIRSIARDLGLKTSYFAFLSSLKRTKIGSFDIKNSFTLEECITSNFKILTPFESLYFLKDLKIKEKFIKDLKNGKKIDIDWFITEEVLTDGIYKIHHENNLLAIIKINNSKFSYDLVY